MSTKLPLRMSIAKAFSDNTPKTRDDIVAELTAEYGTEGQFTPKGIEMHLQSLKAVGILREHEARLNARNELEQAYQITSFGIDKIKSSI